jgi:quercetin dioxygenase-like cupin family protein
MSDRRPRGLDPFLRELDALGRRDARDPARVDDRDPIAATLALSARPAAPSGALRDRVLLSIATTHRFEDLEERLAELVDLPRAAAASLLLAIDSATAWSTGPRSGVELLHFAGGPAVASAITGLVRIAPGAEFPEHEHVGDETVLVLQGALRDSSGSEHRRGEILPMPASSVHSLRAIGTVALIYLAVIHGGVRIDGTLFGPGDPGA